MLTGLAAAEWTAEHDAALERFAQDPSEPVLTIFVDPCAGLKLDLGMPVQVGAASPGPRGLLPGRRGLASPHTAPRLTSGAQGVPGLAASARQQDTEARGRVCRGQISWSGGEDRRTKRIHGTLGPGFLGT